MRMRRKEKEQIQSFNNADMHQTPTRKKDEILILNEHQHPDGSFVICKLACTTVQMTRVAINKLIEA